VTFTSKKAGSQGRLVTRAGLWAACGAALLVVPLALAGCSQATPAPKETYGSLPAYLKDIQSKSDTAGSDTTLTGTAAKPALTSEGDAVSVELPGGGSVLVTVTGPVVPGEGLPYQTASTTCTWTLTLSKATTTVPIVLTDMSTLDQLGTVYRLSAVPSEPAPPTSIAPGETKTFEVRARMKVGEGLFRWAPGATAKTSTRILAEWDFEVEND
jgi:hypothetical protein